MIELQQCTDKEQWDDFVLDNDGHPLQLWSWGQVKSAHGWQADRVFAYDEDDIVGGAQILIRRLPGPLRAFAYIPRGPSYVKESHREEFYAAIAAYVKRKYKAVTLSVEPDTLSHEKPERWMRATNKILPAETILLDLTKSESGLLADMAKKTRQYIRKSAADVTIKQVRSMQDIEACLAIYKETATRAGFNLHSKQYYLDVFQQMKDYSPIFVAYENDTPVAFLWLAISNDIAYELYGGVTERGQELRANYALKWHAIRKTKEWELTRYDFGGLVVGGVTTFKQGWSSDVTVFAGTFDIPLSPLYVIWSKALPFAKKAIQTVRSKKK